MTKKREVAPVLRIGEMFRWAMAGIVLVLLLAQLFHFERFPELLVAVGNAPWLAMTLAIVLVVMELLALPWLLAMRIDQRLTVVSGASAVMALGLLTVLELMAYSRHLTVMFGATLDVPAGLWSPLFVAGVWTMMAFGLADAYVIHSNKRRGKR